MNFSHILLGGIGEVMTSGQESIVPETEVQTSIDHGADKVEDVNENLTLVEKDGDIVFDPFNLNQEVNYTSDDDDSENNDERKCDGNASELISTNNEKLESNQSSSDEESDSGSNTSSTSDSDSDVESDSESDSSEESENENDSKFVDEGDEDEFNEDETEGPIRSKNEIFDFKVPTLPEDYTIDNDTRIQFVGHISGVVEKNVMIKSATSAEDRVLNEGTIFCFEDRTPLGLMFEVFGRLQTPVYTVKFNTLEESTKWADRKGEKVFFVVPTAEYISTIMIRKLKGTDASNFNDEELAEEEQEFSDDEKEAAAKKSKKRKKKSTKQITGEEASSESKVAGPATIKKQKQVERPKVVNNPVNARLTSLPTKTPVTSNNNYSAPISQSSNSTQAQPNPMAMMQQFMTVMQQAAQMTNTISYQNQPPAMNPAYGQASNQFYGQQNSQLNQPINNNIQQYSNQQYQQYNGQYNGQYNQPTNMNVPYNAQFPQYNNYLVNPNTTVPVQQPSYNSVQTPHQPQTPSSQPSYPQEAGNTALLVAQLADAISKNASGAANTIQQVYGDVNNNNNQNDEEYNPSA